MAGSTFIIPPHDAAGSAARSTIAFYFRALAEQVAAAQNGEVEPIHQVRVASRRLRAAVRLFSPYIQPIKPRDIEERLKWIGAQAGAVREFDMLEKLSRRTTRKLDPEIVKELDPIWEEFKERRKEAAEHLAKTLNSPRYKSLAKQLSGRIEITAEGDVAFAAVAPKLISPMLKSAIKAGEKLGDDPAPDSLHRLRKRSKNARYALEMMMGLGGKALRQELKRLEDLQEVLGDYHDAAVAVDWMKNFVSSRELLANVAFGCGALAESIQRLERKLKRRSLKAWDRFISTDPYRTVIKTLEKAQPKGGSSDEPIHNAARDRRGSHPQGR